MTAQLRDLLERVRAVKPGEEGEAERRAIARDWCKLWMMRIDYPELGTLINRALDRGHGCAGYAIALVERVLPGWAWHVQKVDVNAMKSFAIVWIPSQRTQGLRVERADSDMGMETPALALVAATLAALISKGDEG